jgi:CheY-like chemotaxis protein
MAKIMLVEDDNNLREIYGARLLAEGHEIVAAKDGEEALAVAVKEKPDLIISDVMMPKISGFDMLDILRNAPETKFTKVIMMTALSQTEDKARADSLGADRYLVKSQVTLEDVARVVKDVLEGKTEADNVTTTLDPKPTPSAPDQVPPPETTPTPEPTPSEVPPPAPVTTEEPASPTTPAVAVEPPSAPAISTPEFNPVVAQTSATSSSNDDSAPVNSTPDPATSATAIDPSSSANDSSFTAPTPPAQINVELPSLDPPKKTDEQPAEETTPESTTTDATPAPEVSSIGPNLAEALEQESAETPADKSEIEPVNTTPTVVNGTESNLITPTAPAPEQNTEATTPNEPTPEPPSNPLDDEGRKKVVIQPINDLTNGPDLNALMEAEEKKAPVVNPPANAVIAPVGTAPEVSPASTPAPTSEHDVISL